MPALTLNKRSGNYTVQIPRPELKSGKSTGSFCVVNFDEFFDIPEDAIDMRLILTKSPSEGAYEMKHTSRTEYSLWGGSHRVQEYTLDGFRVPSMLSTGSRAFEWALAQGYTHVKIDYRVPKA